MRDEEKLIPRSGHDYKSTLLLNPYPYLFPYKTDSGKLSMLQTKVSLVIGI